MLHRTGTALVILSAAIAPALHASTLDVTSGTLTCLATPAVNNALTISASGANYVFHDTGETITLSANAISAGWSGSGSNTVQGPIASVTTDFKVNLLDGADALTLSTPVNVPGIVQLFSGGSFTNNGAVSGSLMTLIADSMTLNGAVGNAGTMVLTLEPFTPTRAIDVGSNTAGKLSLTQAAISQLTAADTVIGGSDATFTGGISITAPIVGPPLAGLTFRSGGPIAGPSPVTVQDLVFADTSTAGHTWTVNASSVQEDANTPISYVGTRSLGVDGGSGSDTFNVTPAENTSIEIEGGLPAPPVFPGDALHVNTTGTTVTGEAATPEPDGLLGVYTFSNRQPIGFAQIESGVASPPAIVKSFGAASIAAGSTISLSFTITNPNTLVGLTGVGFSDPLPAGLIVATPSGLTGSCGSGTISAGGSTVTLSRGTLAAGGACTFSVNVLATSAGNLMNTTSVVTSAEGGPGNAATASLAVVAPDLTVTKTHAGSFIQGATGTYTITVTNSGSGATNGTVTVVDTLPTGMTATAMSGSGWSCNAGTLTCTRSDSLAAGTSFPAIALTVFVSANAPSSLTNSVTVSGGGELNAANDAATDVTAIAPGANVPALSVWMLLALGAALVVVGLRKIG